MMNILNSERGSIVGVTHPANRYFQEFMIVVPAGASRTGFSSAAYGRRGFFTLSDAALQNLFC